MSSSVSRIRAPGAGRFITRGILPLLLVGATLVFTPADAGAIRPLETGVTGVDVAFVGDRIAYERVRSAGARWTRVIVFWKMIVPGKEPRDWDPTDPDDPNYDWSETDASIKLAVDAGLSPLVSVYTAPEWAAIKSCGQTENPDGICSPETRKFADFAEALAKRYSGKFEGLPQVRYWKVWNEPNSSWYFMPQRRNGRKVSPGLYRGLVNAFSDRVKKVNPSNRVVGGGLAPLGRPPGIAPLDFMRRVLCLKGRKKLVRDSSCKGKKARFDVWAMNPYTSGRPTHRAAGTDQVSMGNLPEMKKTLDAGVRFGQIRSAERKVPFWVTEMSWDSKGPDPNGVPMNRLRYWVSEAMYRSWRAGVSNFFWLSLRDWPKPQSGDPRRIESGLYFRGATIAQDRPKPILQSFRFPFVGFRKARGIEVWGRTPDSGPGTVSIEFRSKKSGPWRQIGSKRAGSNGMFSGLVRTGLGKNRLGEVRARMLSGRSSPQNSALFPLKLDRVKYQPPFGT